MFVNRIKICPDLHKLLLWFSRIRQCLFFKLLRQWTHKMGHFLSTIKHSHPYRSAAHVLSSTYCLKLNVNTSVVIYFGRESNEGQFLTSNCVGKVSWMNVVYKKGHKGLTFIRDRLGRHITIQPLDDVRESRVEYKYWMLNARF
jgi:hypothetical protein